MARTALIVGALGLTGRAILERLDKDPNWNVVALSRRAPDFPSKARFISIDLADAALARAALGDLRDVTHLFYTAYTARPTMAEEAKANLEMLVHLVDAIEPVASHLERVQLMHGNKWYGSYLGAYKTPAREDDPRPMPPNLYHAQQDWLVERQRGKQWTWSALRPHGIWGFSTGSAFNLLNGIAAFATISRHLGLPLRFPGKPGAYDCVYQMIDLDILGEAMEWAATAPAAANEAFNVSNGDFMRWRNVWPQVADFFGMDVGPLQTLPLTQVMADKAAVWDEIVKKNSLKPYGLEELVNWQYLDFALGNEFDQMSNLGKIRAAGWTRFIDTEDTITAQLSRLRENRIIP